MSVSLDNIVDVVVETVSPFGIDTDFSTGCIIGNTAPEKFKADNRAIVYDIDSWQSAMTTDGFSNTDPEYKAAQLYFSQQPSPSKLVVGEKLSTDSIAVEAINACRQANTDWYGVCFAFDIASEISNIAAALEAYSQPSIFIYQTNDKNCLVTSQSNIMKTLQEANYSRSCGFYSNVENFAAAVLGRFSGLNSADPNSAYTFAYKTLTGVSPEDISDAQKAALEGYNGNAYINYSKRYALTTPTVVADGTHLDETYFIDLAKYLIQQFTVSGLVSQLKVPQTESGMNTIISYITNACERLLSIGFIGPGIWNGKPILNLDTGMAVPSGYMIMADSISSQDPTDRQNRVTPPVYVCLKASGSIEHVVIRAYVNR